MALGLVIGVASITLTVATGEGARRAVERAFRSMLGDMDVILVMPGGSASRGMAVSGVKTLSLDDAQAIATEVANVRAVGTEQSAFNTLIQANGKNAPTFLFGTSANWRGIRGDALAAGRFFSPDDDRKLARVVVLGADVGRQFFPDGNAVGSRVRIAGTDFAVIGVLAPNGAGPGGISMDNIVYVPIETTRRRVLNRDYLDLISAKLVDERRWRTTQADIVALLRRRHALQGTQLDDFRSTSPEAMIARVTDVNTTLRKALIGVGALALAIGGAVVANLMIAAAVTRQREIAVRRAVGATRNAVLRLFWVEAIEVSLLAAATGVAIAYLLVRMGGGMMRMQLAMSWPIAFGSALLATLVGMLAGYYPARRAASLSPARVLRDTG